MPFQRTAVRHREPHRVRRAARGPLRTAVALAVAAVTVAGCATAGRAPAGRGHFGNAGERAAARQPYDVRIIGDGSTSDTGPQPHQPVPRRLTAGERPPQFVVFSWDGAAEDGQRLFSRFRVLGERHHAAMTYFLSGLYLVPDDRRDLYAPPGRPRGASDIGFADRQGIADTLHELRHAWQDGSEIGTHFNGHFCGPGGADSWTTAQWSGEIRQAERFVEHWKSDSGLTDEDPLPFDYAKELVGGRAPCLRDRRALIPAEKAAGFRYDAGSSGGPQVWPSRVDGLWDFPLQRIPVPGGAGVKGTRREALSMDYALLAARTSEAAASGGAGGAAAQYRSARLLAHDALAAGFARAYRGNRAPLFIGNHFESWDGGAYLDAVADTIKEVCGRPEVRCVSFKQLADWLDAQDPAVLARLRTLPVGQAPRQGWRSFLAGR